MVLYDDDYAKGFDWAVTKRLLGYLAPHKKHIAIAFVGALMTVTANVAGPPLIAFAVDEGIRAGDLWLVLAGVVGYLFIEALGLLGFRIQIINMATAGQRVIQTLRDQLFTHVQTLSLSFFSKYKTGRLIARIISDVNVLREAITFAVVGSFRDFLILIGILIAMLIINVPLTGVALAVVVVLVIIANYWRIYARKAYVRVRETNTIVNSELAEAFNGVRVTQAFARESHNYARFAKQINYDHRQANVRATLVSGLFFPSIELVGGVATGVLIFVGGTLVLNEQLSVFTLLTFVLYIDQFFFPIRMLAQRYNVFQAVMAAGSKIFALLDVPYDIKDQPNAAEMPAIEGHVKFENVNFGYSGSESKDLVLKNITLDVTAGSTVAYVGHTGAGKSSIVRLISRFYDISGGKLTIDGYDIQQVTQESLRRQMGVVLQDTHLFSGSVMDNIRYGRLNATDEEVMQAAKDVGAHDFISNLENGYNTEIREGGALLSSGQKQLLSFARALLADPRILILDEATSSIDTQTEKIIQQALKRLLKGRTSFVIAHRLSTIVNADLIVVMDHGEIIEQGTHEELLALGGIYHNLYTMAYARPLEAPALSGALTAS